MVRLRNVLLLTVMSWFAAAAPQAEDAVARLSARINHGEASLEYDDTFGYLPSVLRELSINVDSQVLVFTKTSMQRDHISPATPRAIYFNDEAAVGYVRGGDWIELSIVQPQGRLRYYTLETHKTATPTFQVEGTRCNGCHAMSGMTVTSSFPAADGTAFFSGTSDFIDHRTPIEDRWGGWYVTGTHGRQKHMGNAVAISPKDSFHLQTDETQNLTSLEARIDPTRYMAPTSDIVALMTLEHQARMTNLIIDASDNTIDKVADYMLFVGEPALIDPVKGVSTFTRTFTERGPRDKKGRSLRDFDLTRRLFRYPLSYMVYSDVFANLKPTVRSKILQRVAQILTTEVADPKYAFLSAEDRRAILEIASDTIPDFRGH